MAWPGGDRPAVYDVLHAGHADHGGWMDGWASVTIVAGSEHLNRKTILWR